MLNIEKYKDKIIRTFMCNGYSAGNCYTIFDAIEDVADDIGGVSYGIEVIEWLCSEYKEPIINDTEKEFLQNLRKYYEFDRVLLDSHFICIINNDGWKVDLPTPSGLFQGMYSQNGYLLEELGIE